MAAKCGNKTYSFTVWEDSTFNPADSKTVSHRLLIKGGFLCPPKRNWGGGGVEEGGGIFYWLKVIFFIWGIENWGLGELKTPTHCR